MSSRRSILVAVLLAAVAAAGCGQEAPPPPEAAPPHGGQGATKDPDQAFLQAMVPHHAGAVEMSKVAATEARSSFVRRLADSIERAQVGEMALMRRIHERRFRAPLAPDMAAHSALGLSAAEAGMDHMGAAAALRGRRPFDRAFVDEMVPHHAGAVRMAEALLARGRDPEVRALAREVVRSQRREIRAMNRFREAEFGAPVPAAPDGGRPGHHPG